MVKVFSKNGDKVKGQEFESQGLLFNEMLMLLTSTKNEK